MVQSGHGNPPTEHGRFVVDLRVGKSKGTGEVSESDLVVLATRSETSPRYDQ